MSTIPRTLGNLRKIGLLEYWHQLHYIGDTKAGVLVGRDRFGNKYYENNEELPLRTRWVDYTKHDFDAAHLEPGWHAWISYLVDKPPTEDVMLQPNRRRWESVVHVPNLTATRGAYKPYSTTQHKLSSWEPMAVERKEAR